MSNILENIKQIRTNLRYSQEYVAEKMGIEQASFGLIENGKRQLKYKTLEQIAMVFNIPVIDIITYPDVYIKKDSGLPTNRRVTLQIDIEEDEVKADVIKLAFGERVLEIKNKKKHNTEKQ